MNCRDVVELLIDYLDGELPAEQLAQIREHINGCPPCVVYVQTYQLTITLCRRLPATPPPATVLERLRAAAAQDRAES